MAKVLDNAEINLVLQTMKLNITKISQNSSLGRILQLTAPKYWWMMSISKFSKLTECLIRTDLCSTSGDAM